MKIIILFTILLTWGVLAQDYDSERDYSDPNQEPLEQSSPPQESYNEPAETPRVESDVNQDYDNSNYKAERELERTEDQYSPQAQEDTSPRITEETPYDNYESEEDRDYEE